jgi:SAM-dependent methyltransferase
LEWVEPFYSQGGRWWGPAEARIGADAVARADDLERLTGSEPKRILELGAGYGATAAVLAERGHEVVAVELSPVRAEYARRFAAERPAMRTVEGDFYALDFGNEFDLVCYWNGFGVGTDADQRRLLRRISSEWLRPSGRALVTVFSPWFWAREAGRSWHRAAAPEHGYATDLTQARDFDPVRGRFVDRWWPTGAPDRAIAQNVRCYTPVDLLLLLEGTGLALERTEIGGEPIDPERPHTTENRLWDVHEYLTVLKRH